ncbi:MAG: hypothetical protein KTR29_07070 [Rhodothermaceae bacterium]|nr:hypothetical protein [Rhodothermaceae bacterium]
MSSILKVQRKRNLSTSQHWDYYEGHRQQVMSLLEEVSAGKKGRLCILGAGNCNDIELPALVERFDEIHLVDWDADSLQEGIKKQGIARESVVLHTGIELTGIGHYIERWKKTPPSNRDIDQGISLLSEPLDVGIDTAFDVVLSSSLLTQLIELPIALLGSNHSRTEEVVLKIRAAHFRLMASLMAARGTGVLVTELISSNTCKELFQCPEDRLSELYYQLIEEQRYFQGTNPKTLIPALLEDPFMSSQIAETKLTAPWRWLLGPERSFLAYGFVFRKK